MRDTCAVGFLAVTLAVVACLSANATVTEATARKAVEAAQKSTNQVCEKAKGQLSNAKFVLGQVELFKKRAELAASKSEAAARGYAGAEDIAKKIKNLSEAVGKLYQNTKETVQNTVNRMEELFSEAKTLVKRSDIKILPNGNSPNDYTETNNKALILKSSLEALEKEITDVVKPMADEYSTVEEMEQHAEDAKLANYQVSAVVALAKIETMIRDADAHILKTEMKRKEVNDIVQEMKELSKTAPAQLIPYVNRLCMGAENELIDFSDAIENAKKAKEAMLKQKELADGALEKVKTADEFREASDEVTVAESCVKEVEKIVPQLESSLQTADISARNVNNRKQDVVIALSQSSSKPPTDQGKVTEKADRPVEEGAEPHHKDATIKPTITDPDQPVKDSTANPEKDGKSSGHGAREDIAATISVPLLVTLIACAALH